MESIKREFYQQILFGIRLINKKQYFNTQVKIVACILHRFPNGLVMAASLHCKMWNVLCYSYAIGLCNTPYSRHEQAVCRLCRQNENGLHSFGIVEPGNVLPNQKRSDFRLPRFCSLKQISLAYQSVSSIIFFYLFIAFLQSTQDT
jgi:hypothetical protein